VHGGARNPGGGRGQNDAFFAGDGSHGDGDVEQQDSAAGVGKKRGELASRFAAGAGHKRNKFAVEPCFSNKKAQGYGDAHPAIF